jgi:FlaA1/EpsC-like NDP-sugar epimerase
MVLTLDMGLCTVAVLLAYSLRVGEWQVLSLPVISLALITCALWLIVAPLKGVYHSLLRFSGGGSIKDLGASCLILGVCLTVLLVGIRIPQAMPRTLAVLVPLIFFVFLAISRIVLSALLRETLYARSRNGRRRVLIYGAGVGGRELGMALKEDPEFRVIGFMDDNPVLRSRRMEGYRIWHPIDLKQVLATGTIDEILLAIPSAPRARRRDIVEQVGILAPRVQVRSLPNLAEIASGRISVTDLREVRIEELLGRDQVEPDPNLMSANVLGQCVAVTGAGGSIGGELCRQILLQCPSRIVLAERSELALYEIERQLHELRQRHCLNVEIVAKLVDVADQGDIKRVFRDYQPNTVFHAAAYKHVPLVEADPIAGLRNNVLGTYHSCLVAEECGVTNFTLVSTDKAVRPTSVMGASKRVCELIVLSRGAAQKATTYSAVRFGNVLGSSGSVVPLFRQQIANGGPVTITHRDATRYFMTVSEAAQLVVQAGAMASGGEIFVLDMGEPVRIQDLARMMVHLSGLAVAGERGEDGDIEIVEVGLRPGEKVHEELLIDHYGLPTSHPRIVKASESGVCSPSFGSRFSDLLLCLDRRDLEGALLALRALLSADVTGELTANAAPGEAHSVNLRRAAPLPNASLVDPLAQKRAPES